MSDMDINNTSNVSVTALMETAKGLEVEKWKIGIVLKATFTLKCDVQKFTRKSSS